MLGLKFAKNDNEKARFFLMLNTSLRSGLPLYQSLIIMKDTLPFYWKDIVSTMATNIRNGYSLYQTMQIFKDTFEPITLRLIAVGERTGRLDDICKYLFEYYENKSKVISRLISALNYPLFIFVFALIISYIILNFILPVVIGIYDELNMSLPFITKVIMVFVMNIFSFNNVIIFFVLFLLILGGLYVFLGKEKLREIFQVVISNLPIISNIYKKYVVNNFLYAFVLCIKSGLTASEAIKISITVIPQNISKKYFSDVYKRVLEGEELSKILVGKPIFNKIVINFIASYEETAKTEVIDKLISYLSFDINLSIDRILILIEPLLVVGISIFVFFIAIAVLLPLINISVIIQ